KPPPPKPPPPKVRKGRKPPPMAPKKMPDKPAAEAEPTNEPKPEPETLDGDLPNQWGDPNGESADVGKTFGAVDGKVDGTGPVEPPAPPPPVILPAGATRPEVIGSLVTEADYPRAALAARLEGTVIVKVAVQVDGSVKLVKFLKRDPNFDDAVLSILKRLRFKPAIYNGKPIAVYQNLKFPFTFQ
ncbi:MAG: energy transducer TonB, partial [Deltaproteobacteria bacterium]